ncbi:MAG: hypothetical protein WB683_03045 [Candidatus Sulfotelmatobacter sp.]
MAIREIETADGWKVTECDHGHTTVQLLDDEGEPLAETCIGDKEDVDNFILTLLGGACPDCMIERLKGLIEKIKFRLHAATEAVTR